MPRIVCAAESSPAKCADQHESMCVDVSQTDFVFCSITLLYEGKRYITYSGTTDKPCTYLLEELLVHEERLTTSGVGTGEQWYLLVVLPAS